ncbi:MAG TPA: pyruvate dehydrogenase complex E1 component subunit beta [Methylomirabilota bacterium]|jgi:pyruvate dehydrogenase E1 component beta subunit|nr:pyruvate dehydrogenase complex E1 component subunit beta [Methylomirabilota bacterium]
MRELTYREALREAMAEEMERDERVFLMGEEVGHYNGAYKVSEGLLEQFGERRVVDTPIAETGFAGVGIGAAMVGLRPIIEFMTWNFSLCAYDQLVNNAAKLRYMSGGQIELPIVFRGPGGAAHQLAAQHSQVVESLYAYVPGLKVVAPATPYDAKGLLKSAIRDDNPIVFIEGEVLYGRKGQVPDEEYTIPLGKGDVKREGKDVTIIAWSKMVYVAQDAAAELAKQSIEVEIIDPRTIRPLDEEVILRSVRKTNRCVIVEEGWPFAGAGAEISYRVTNKAFDYLDSPVVRVTAEDVPMPYAKNLEHLVLPNVEKVVNAVKSVLYRS